ncbi:MAG: response regulator [Gemmatimonadales bacterium]
MIIESAVALTGVMMQWAYSVLLLLLCYRLGRVGTHRRMLWTWALAWAAQVLAVTGYAFQAIATMSGRPLHDTLALRTLDALYLPGMLLFTALAALGVARAAGRPMSLATERVLVLAAIAAGIAAALLDDAILTGMLLMAATASVFLVGGVRIAGAERRRRRQRRLLAMAMGLFGVVALAYQACRYFGAWLNPLGEFGNLVLTTAGYASALTSVILGGAVAVMVTEDGFRAHRFTQRERARELAASRLRLVAVADAAARAEAARGPAQPVPESQPPMEKAVVAIDERAGSPAVIDVPLQRRMPATVPRITTLPRPVRRPDGTVSWALVIDDEAAARSTLARIFQRGGWAVREASTGAEALTWLLEMDPLVAPAVVVCGLERPGIGGRELYAHLQRQRPEFLPLLIVVTDDTEDARTTEFLRSAGCQWIHRPINVDEVARAVEQVV